MKKVKNKTTEYWWTFTAFALPAVLFCGLLAVNGIAPFGNKDTICWADATDQYIGYFGYYQDLFTDGASPFFSFAKLIGGDTAGFMAYYLMSPFNLLFLLFPTATMQSAMAVVGAVKIGSAGLAAAVYFERHTDSPLKTMLLSTAYGLMSYNLIYIPNIMWIDGVIILPLIALGIDFIFEKRTSLLYIIALFYGIVTNYYIGFMLCIASVIYFFWNYTTDKICIKDRATIPLRFAVSSTISGMLSMFVLVPALVSLEGSSKTQLTADKLLGFTNLLSFKKLVKHLIFPGTTMQEIDTMLPNVFVGFVITALCLFFVISFKVSLGKKIAAAVIAVVFLLSFYFENLYFIWHGIGDPVCFEYRFAFAASFFALLIAAEALQGIALPKYILWLTIAANCASLIWYGNSNYGVARLPGPHFEAFVNENLPLVEQIKENETGFYRIEKDYKFNNNDAMSLGYNGLTHYSSGEKLVTREPLKKAGYATVEAYGFYGNGSTLASDGFFGIKYLLYKNTSKLGLEKLYTDSDVTTYKNPYTWPLAFKADSAVTKLNLADVTVGFLPQQTVKAALGKEIEPVKYVREVSVGLKDTEMGIRDDGAVHYHPLGENSTVTYSFTMPVTSNLYMNLITPSRNTVESVACGEWEIKGYPGFFDYGVRFVGVFEKDEEVTVTLKLKEDLLEEDMMFLYDCFDGLDEMNSIMQENGFEVSDFGTDKFTVKGSMDSTGGIMLMIPYHEGWKFYMDGEHIEALPVIENFVYLPVAEGDFEINAKFATPMLKEGAIISFAALAFGIIWIVLEKRKILSENKDNNF